LNRLDSNELLVIFVIALFVFCPFNGKLSHRIAIQRFDGSLQLDQQDEPTYGKAFSVAIALLLGVFLLVQFWLWSAN
jgi:hypothetical protein